LESTVRDYLRDYQTTIENGSISSRITFSASVSIFYAFLTTPVLYALRSTTTASDISNAGACLAWLGATLEAIADLQKLVVKQSNTGVKEFVGPTSWAYSICRHPNYLGEILFWTGVFVGGAPSFGKSIAAWVSSILGLFGILSIMSKATKGLEKRQSDKYNGESKYDEWKEEVKYSLIPFVH
jgi:steroid 5-alpha reductase family enzyme